MKLFALIPALLLVGCVSVPVTQHFPKVPDTLMTAAPDLREVDSGASASAIFETVIDNYGTYYEVANRLKAWQQWYQDQKKIFDEIQ